MSPGYAAGPPPAGVGRPLLRMTSGDFDPRTDLSAGFFLRISARPDLKQCVYAFGESHREFSNVFSESPAMRANVLPVNDYVSELPDNRIILRSTAALS